MDEHHGRWQLLWALVVAMLLASVGAGYYLLQHPDELETEEEEIETACYHQCRALPVTKTTKSA